MWVYEIASRFTVSAGRRGDKLNTPQQMAIFAVQMAMLRAPERISGWQYSTQGSDGGLNRPAGYIGVMAQANIDESLELAPPNCTATASPMWRASLLTVAARFLLTTTNSPPQTPPDQAAMASLAGPISG